MLVIYNISKTLLTYCSASYLGKHAQFNILLEKGCRNIGLIGWEQGDATWLGRWQGYQAGVDAWNEANPDDQATLSDPQYAGTTSEGGAKAADALMAADPDLDALIPAGAITGFAAFINSIKVGSVTASGGNQVETQILIALVLGGVCRVPFSSVVHPKEELGRKAAENMVRMIHDPQFNGNCLMEGDLVVRNSVARR